MGWEGAAAAAAAPAEVAPAGQGWASPRHGPKLSGESCGAAGPRTAPFLMHHHASVLQLPQLLTPGGQWGNFWRWGGWESWGKLVAFLHADFTPLAFNEERLLCAHLVVKFNFD